MATILITDDNKDTRKMLKLMIESYTGHQTITAGNGRECLSAAPRADLILMDIQMPEMDGIQAYRALRDNPRTSNIPIIFMTAYPDQIAERISSEELGTINYLLKPVAEEQLMNQLKVLLGIRGARARFQETHLSPSDQFILLLAALEQSADGITVTDRKGSWLMINHAEASMFGYTTDEFLNLRAEDIYQPESARLISTVITRKLEQNDHWEGELRGKKKNGVIFPVLVSLSVVKNNAGTFIGVMGISKDISELKKAFTDLQKAQEALVRVERMKALGEMTGGLSHDFNNLLASILGNTQLLMGTVSAEADRRRLMSIERATETAAGLLRKMLSMTEEDMGDKAIRQGTVYIRKILEDSLTAARDRAADLFRKEEITIEIQTRLRRTPPIRGDEEGLKTSIVNVIFNAIDALPEGGKIKVRNWARDNYVFIRVSDTGTGMSPKIMDKSFEPYFTTRRPLHSGLGLSVTYGIIKKHGGRIRLRSRVGRGTNVTIRLPIN